MSIPAPGGFLPSTRTYDDGQPTSTWTSTATGATEAAVALVDLMSALDATMSATDPEYTRPPIALEDDPAATENALSILFQALPSAQAIAIASEYGLQLTSAASRPTPQILMVPSSISGATVSTTSTISTSSPSESPVSTSSTPTSSLLSTTLASPTTSLAPVFTTTMPASEHIKNSTIAGIVSGVTAGTVLIIIGIVFLLRRRQQGKRPFQHLKVYPEVAWLYDPAPTPPATMHRRHDSGEETLLKPRQDEMEEVRIASPERSARVTSPLLPPPQSPVKEDDVVKFQRGGAMTIRTVRRSSANSAGMDRRPMHAIFEESQAQ